MTTIRQGGGGGLMVKVFYVLDFQKSLYNPLLLGSSVEITINRISLYIHLVWTRELDVVYVPVMKRNSIDSDCTIYYLKKVDCTRDFEI